MLKLKKKKRGIGTHRTVICLAREIFLGFSLFYSSISRDQSETDNLLLLFSDLPLCFSPARVPARSHGRARRMTSGRGTWDRQKARAVPRAPPLAAWRSRGAAFEPPAGRCSSPEHCSGSRIHCPWGAGIWHWVWWESLPSLCPPDWCHEKPRVQAGEGHPRLTSEV